AGGLGRFLRRDEASFPHRRHYWRADTDRAAGYRAKAIGSAKRLIGISWISKNEEFGTHKSLALSEWRNILSLPDTAFVTLQYGDTAVERTAAKNTLGVPVTEVPDLDLFNDIDGLAALIAACDLVITVSNTTAHVAGALGVPTWVLAPSGAGKLWYWFFDRTDSPWYPAVRIFRQSVPGSWSEPLAAAANALSEFAHAGN
ncbi:MAG: hypothetical protein KDA71_06455, partial [Planctomycetales bacterium]|nr:hypothetical protein [Planctomycetales bacterium]